MPGAELHARHAQQRRGLPPRHRELGGSELLLSLTVIRMLPVAVAMVGTRSSLPTIAYLGWFGPRGLASIVFAVIVVESSVPHSSTIVDAAALTVTASIVLHGLSAGPLTERYARWVRRRPRQAGAEAARTSVHVPAGGVRWPPPER